MQGGSLGLIETQGYTAAVEAVDVACKTGRVTFIGHTLVGMGLVTVKLSGDVAAVRAAVSAGSAAAQKVGRVISVHVIPRPHGQLTAIDTPSPDIFRKEFARFPTEDLQSAADLPENPGPGALRNDEEWRPVEADEPATTLETDLPSEPEPSGTKSRRSKAGKSRKKGMSN